MSREWPVIRAIRKRVHRWVGPCEQDGHTALCNGLVYDILHVMHRYGLPSGPPIRHQKELDQ